MSWPDGQIGVRVAFDLGPFDTPTEFDWTDLTDRVKSYRDRRGRPDVLGEFQPGTAEAVLDNGDRMLDPSNPDGLVYAEDGNGLPLCPVKITQWWDGTEYTKFTGVLGPEAWPGDIAPRGPSGTVTLYAVDALGHSPSLPTDAWGVMVASLHPDWWSRMDDFEFPVLDDGSPIPDALSDAHGTVEGTTGISRAWDETELQSVGVFAPGLLLSGDHQVRFPAASIMPDGDQDKFTVITFWSARNQMVSGQADVIRCVHPITGLYRWSVYVDSADGKAYVTTFDAAEVEVDTAVISLPGSGRFDAGHLVSMVVARWDAGSDNNLTVWFGDYSATLSIPGDLYESDLLIGPAPVDTIYDEVAVWRRTLGIDLPPEIAGLFLGFAQLSWWAGQTFHDRLGGWIEATGRDVTSDDTEQMHIPADVTNSLWGLIRNKPITDFGQTVMYGTVTLPKTLAEAFQVTVANAGGVTWATKENVLRARILQTLSDSEFAEHYATPVLFTDEDTTLGAGEFRHGGVEVTGLRIDRVINDASVKFLYSDAEPPDINTASWMVCRKRDSASIGRYGLRASEMETDWADWPLNQTLANQLVERFAQPQQEFGNIHLDPTGTGDDASSLAEWLITTCELEQACTVTYTPYGADPVTVEGLNIQQIATTWTPESWSVDIVAAKS